MNALKNIWSDLVEKKLWPVALGLVVLIVGALVMLPKPTASTEAAVPPPPAVETDDGPQLALTRASTTGFARPPRVNDERLDPFASRVSSAQLKKVEAALSKAVNDIISGGGSSGAGGGGSSPSPSPGTSSPSPGTEKPGTEKPDPVATERDDLLSILVTKTGEGAGEPVQISDIRTFTPLVDVEDPFLVYVGKTADGGATFLVSADVTVSGDGSCAPSQADCRTLTLAIGETAEFTQVKDPANKTAVTVLDVETKRVPVDALAAADSGTDDVTTAGGDTATDDAAEQLKAAAARRAGAKAVKSVLSDRLVVKALKDDGVKFRH